MLLRRLAQPNAARFTVLTPACLGCTGTRKVTSCLRRPCNDDGPRATHAYPARTAQKGQLTLGRDVSQTRCHVSGITPKRHFRTSARRDSNNDASTTPLPLAARIVDSLPSRLKPYARLMRLEKPIGSWLLFWPSAWGILAATARTNSVSELTMTSSTSPDMTDSAASDHATSLLDSVSTLSHLSPAILPLTLFGCGAILLRGAGCTVNDLWDRDIDNKVSRTATRPLAAGEVSVPAAVLFLGAQLSAGLVILLQLNTYTQILAASSLLLVGTYPLMKRITYLPQAYLGLTINWGALAGYSAVAGACDWAVCLPLYAAGWFWTMVYDTVYAHQDVKDDVKAGVKSTALLFGDQSRNYLVAFTAGMGMSLGLAGFTGDFGPAYYGACTAAVLQQLHIAARTDLSDPADCLKGFKRSAAVGAMIAAGLALEATSLLG